MKKIILCFALCSGVLFASTIKAQNATEGVVSFKKNNIPAVVASFNVSQDLLDETLKKKMETLGVAKPEKEKGFKVYKGINIPSIAAEKLDMYVTTDGKKNTSMVNIAISTGNENWLTAQNNEAAIKGLKAWVNELVADAVTVQLGHDVEDATDIEKKAFKTYNSAVEDGADLNNKMEKLKKEIEENKAEQAKKLKMLDEAKQKLEELKTKK